MKGMDSNNISSSNNNVLKGRLSHKLTTMVLYITEITMTSVTKTTDKVRLETLENSALTKQNNFSNVV